MLDLLLILCCLTLNVKITNQTKSFLPAIEPSLITQGTINKKGSFPSSKKHKFTDFLFCCLLRLPTIFYFYFLISFFLPLSSISQLFFYLKHVCPKYDFMAMHFVPTCILVCFLLLHSRIFFHALPYLNGSGKAVQVIRHIWCFFLSKGKPSCEAWAAWAAWAVQSSLTSPFRSNVLQLLKQLWAEGLRGGFELPPQHQGQAPTVGKHYRHWRRKNTAQLSSATDLYYLFFSKIVSCFPHLFFSLSLCPGPTDSSPFSLIFSASWYLLQQDSWATAAQ